MMTRLRDMEKLLEDKGVQIRPWQWTPPYGLTTPFDQDTDPGKDQWTQFFSLWVKDSNRQSQKASNNYPAGQQSISAFQNIDPRKIDARLGTNTENAPLSSINGTQLSILGTTIDITSFSAPDVDGPPMGLPSNTPLYNKSLQSFINSVSKVNPPLDVHLPAREEAFSYSEWFFVMLGPFMPVLHKPSFLRLVMFSHLFFFILQPLRASPSSNMNGRCSYRGYMTTKRTSPRRQSLLLCTWSSQSCTTNSVYETAKIRTEKPS